MIGFENANVSGWKSAIRGMRNPLNSWDKSDSEYNDYWVSKIGENDLELMKKLINAGTDHRKFLRMITVYVDIVAPLYWWREFDTYKVGTVANSCSTMHTIHKKPFTMGDFSFDILLNGKNPRTTFEFTVLGVLEDLRERYNETGDKSYWRRLIQLLPQSYNQRRTVMLNYEVLRSMYHARKAHKLDEWQGFCHWVEKLPYSELITEGDRQ